MRPRSSMSSPGPATFCLIRSMASAASPDGHNVRGRPAADSPLALRFQTLLHGNSHDVSDILRLGARFQIAADESPQSYSTIVP